MRDVPEYDLKNPSTFYVIRESDVMGESERAAFQQELVRIAGVNRFGHPNLMLRWGATFLDSQTYDNLPKYYLSTNDPVLVAHEYRDDAGEMVRVKTLAEVPTAKLSLPIYDVVHLGERRFIIEQWRSPEFLEKSGRYVDAVRRDPETGEELLKGIPPLGYYDFFMRLQRKDGTFHPADAASLQGIEEKWRAQRNQSFAEKTAALNEARGKEAAEARKRRRDIWHPDNMLTKPTEEEKHYVRSS